MTSLHTGSIPSLLGKPLMVFMDLDRAATDSFPQLRSDHDVMFVLEDLPVITVDKVMAENQLVRENLGTDGNGEFVKIRINGGQCCSYLKNSVASEFLSDVINSKFFAGCNKETNRVLVTRAGPSVNVKVMA